MRKKILFSTIIPAFLLMLCAAGTAPGRVMYVDDDRPADFNNIHAAIDDANSGDTVVVAEGTYFENVHLHGKNITLTSRSPTDANVVARTIIDGGALGSVVTFDGTESSSCVLSGLTIRNGRAAHGGGICGNGTAATIQDNIICENEAIGEEMPGAYGRGGGLSRCHGIIQNNRISQNSAMMGGGLSDCAGVIRNNTIAHNLVGYLGGGLHNCSGIIQNNTILCNSTVGHGGGLAYCAGTIRNNVIVCNLAPYGAGGALHHCGGHIENNTIFGNSAGNGGGGLDDCDATVVNCIIWQNSPDQLREVLTVRYSDVQGGWPAEGNIDVDPCFADVGYWDPNGTPEDANDDFWVDGDYHLKSQAGRWDAKSQSWVKDDVTSPCIDAGDPASPVGQEAFPNGGVINMGAYGGTMEASKSYFGEPVCETIVAGDINGDCKVDFTDFAIMATHWLEDNTPRGVVTTTYEFLPDWSEVRRHYCSYPVKGLFQLIVDYDVRSASFSQVDATISEEIYFYDYCGEEPVYTNNLDMLFHMTELVSTNINDTTIDFVFEKNIPTFPYADVGIRITFLDDSVQLVGGFQEPIHARYGGYIHLNAVAVCEHETSINMKK